MTTISDRWQTLVLGMAVVTLVFGVRIGLLLHMHKYPFEPLTISRSEPQTSTPPWVPYLAAVDDALARKNVSGALHAWRDAHAAALGSRRWEGALAVGEAYLRIADAANFRRGAEATARRSFLTALLRARRDESLEGVLKSAAAFQALGDRAVVDQAVHIAVSLVPDLTADIARARIVELAGQPDTRAAAASPTF